MNVWLVAASVALKVLEEWPTKLTGVILENGIF
jgi:hypothetical protein